MAATHQPLDIFQPGLKRGAASLPFAPHKRYAYVEHPKEGWRVYLRNAAFLHQWEGSPNIGLDPTKFLVVKTTGAGSHGYAWEPPKGQMEGKDMPGRGPLLKGMMDALSREIAEEAKIENVLFLQHTGLVFQGREKDYPPNHFFQYHIFRGFVDEEEIDSAQQKFQWLKDHPKAYARMRKDFKEKDAMRFYSPKHTRLFGSWAPALVMLYSTLYRK
jgi:hypothetical protein